MPAALGAILLLAAGVALVVADRRLPGWAVRRPPGRTATAPDRAAAWEALDAGRDPTADPDAPARPADGGASGDPSSMSGDVRADGCRHGRAGRGTTG